MTVFKGFLKVLNKCKGVVIMYTVMLLFFGAFNLSTSDENNMSFKEEKPDVLIINNDENKGVTKNLIDFIKDNTNIVKMDNDEEKIDEDSYFYSKDNLVFKNQITAEEQTQAINEAQTNMKNSVEENSQLLKMAQERAKALIEQYITQLGELSKTNYNIEWQYGE